MVRLPSGDWESLKNPQLGRTLKRAYLGESLGRRLGISWWASETHVMIGLWSAEVLHSNPSATGKLSSVVSGPAGRLHGVVVRAAPTTGVTSIFVVLDPLASGRQRLFIGLDEAIERAKPRHRGYADVAMKLGNALA